MADSTPEERAKRAAYAREWRMRPENHERVLEQQRQRHERNREADVAKSKAYYWANRDRALKLAKKWQQDNPERSNARKRAWKLANPEKNAAVNAAHYQRTKPIRRAYAKAWAVSRPERVLEYQHRARARRAGLPVFEISEKDLRRLYRGPCIYCGAPEVEMDHVIPLCRGGSHSIGNIVPACPSCNQTKHHRLVSEWRAGKAVARYSLEVVW